MGQVVVLSMWSTLVPPKEQCPERFLCLRDTCHTEVPEEVSFHFLKLACALVSPWTLQCGRAEDIYNQKKIALFPLLSHFLRVTQS